MTERRSSPFRTLRGAADEDADSVGPDLENGPVRGRIARVKLPWDRSRYRQPHNYLQREPGHVMREVSAEVCLLFTRI